MVTEGCQFREERIYLSVTKVSLSKFPNGEVQRVCLWLFCHLTHMPYIPSTILYSYIFYVWLRIQPEDLKTFQLTYDELQYEQYVQSFTITQCCGLKLRITSFVTNRDVQIRALFITPGVVQLLTADAIHCTLKSIFKKKLFNNT